MHLLGAEWTEYQKSYYNDMHEDPKVVEYRTNYLKVEFELDLRAPLWVHLKPEEYAELNLKCREDGGDLGGYPITAAMKANALGQSPEGLDSLEPVLYEIHVDMLDDKTFIAWRAAQPQRGDFSYRWPTHLGPRPDASRLPATPANLPDPGLDAAIAKGLISRAEENSGPGTGPTSAPDAQPPGASAEHAPEARAPPPTPKCTRQGQSSPRGGSGPGGTR